MPEPGIPVLLRLSMQVRLKPYDTYRSGNKPVKVSDTESILRPCVYEYEIGALVTTIDGFGYSHPLKFVQLRLCHGGGVAAMNDISLQQVTDWAYLDGRLPEEGSL